MDLLSQDTLYDLMPPHDEPAISIYMPTHRAGRDVLENPIRYKNLLTEADRQLAEHGQRPPARQELLGPAQRLQTDRLFWEHQADGLAVFVDATGVQTYRLPLSFPEMVVVDRRFHVKPLLPLFTGDGRFYILALSQNDVRLLQGSRHSVAEMDLASLPRSLAEALQYDDPEAQLQLHVSASPGAGQGTTGGTGRGAAVFHGHGAGEGPAARKRIRRFFHKLDAGLGALLRGRQEPLVLAGVDYLFPIYRDANSYPNLMEDGVPGNPETLRPEELHERAWAVVAPYFEQARQASLARYRQLSTSDRVTHRPDEIVPAAHYGRIDTLFTRVDTQLWGRFDPDTGVVDQHPGAPREPDHDDLLELATVETLAKSGTVYDVPADQLPDGALAAAILRH